MQQHHWSGPFPQGMACDLVQVVVRDIYKERDIGKFTGMYRDIVDAHGVLALKLTPVKCAPSRNCVKDIL